MTKSLYYEVFKVLSAILRTFFILTVLLLLVNIFFVFLKLFIDCFLLVFLAVG